jgi:hypothetical protein
MTEAGLERTRTALHAVAELLLAGPQYRASGTIKLRVVPGGFQTWTAPVVAVLQGHLVRGDRRVAMAGATITELGATVGIEPGAPAGLYGDGSGADPSVRLEVDPAAAALITGALAVGDAALRQLDFGVDPVLWPEHFDVGVLLGEVGYGVSPGDGYLAEPYAYLSLGSAPTNGFFNAPFGAARPMSAFDTAAEVLAFFTEGRALSRGTRD